MREVFSCAKEDDICVVQSSKSSSVMPAVQYNFESISVAHSRLITCININEAHTYHLHSSWLLVIGDCTSLSAFITGTNLGLGLA